jgi:signal transduction histidine kinase
LLHKKQNRQNRSFSQWRLFLTSPGGKAYNFVYSIGCTCRTDEEGRLRNTAQQDGRMIECTPPPECGNCELPAEVSAHRRTEEHLRQYAERLQVLHEIDQAILTAQSVQETIQASLSRVRQLVPCQQAAVVEFTAEAGHVTLLATDTNSTIRGEVELHLQVEVADDGAMLRPGVFSVEEDLSASSAASPLLQALLGAGCRSYLQVPLLVENGFSGALYLSRDHPGTFLPEHIEIAREVADQLAIAIQQARLHEQVRRHAAELEARVRERTAQLEAANKELEAFSYSVSHDLRAPLRAIHGFSRILLEDHGSRVAPEVQRYLHLIQQNAQQMGQLIDGLLTFSRLSRQPIHKQTVMTTDLVRQVLVDLESESVGRRVDIVLSELPPCEGDPVLLKQVFMNLLSNAFKYTRQREGARIEIGWYTATARKVYFVRDNGAGFDMQYVHKLFGVFQRLHRAEEYEGTGVGLAIVHRILARHGGWIWADGAVNEGATFYFTI